MGLYEKRDRKITILFLASNPDNTPTLKLDEEIRAITEKIHSSEFRDNLELVPLGAVRPDDLLRALNEHQPQILHFSGHGSPNGEILLMDDDRRMKPVSTPALKALSITMKDNIRLIMLNACFSHVQAEALSEVIDCVIGMRKEIGDDAAITFAASFYQAIGFGRSVRQSFDQGIAALLLEGIPEAETPELLVRSGFDPSTLVFAGATSTVDLSEIPPALKKLLDSRSEFIDVPVPEIIPGESLSRFRREDYLFCELRMRATEAVFVFRAIKFMKIGDAAKYLVVKLLPHLRYDDYLWTFTFKEKEVPDDHTFMTAGIQSGDTVFLYGKNRLPQWAPYMMPDKHDRF
jgi:hypothetical protein